MISILWSFLKLVLLLSLQFILVIILWAHEKKIYSAIISCRVLWMSVRWFVNCIVHIFCDSTDILCIYFISYWESYVKISHFVSKIFYFFCNLSFFLYLFGGYFKCIITISSSEVDPSNVLKCSNILNCFFS